ncbi:MAG: M20 family metallopeptidase [Acidobacteriota bacterium]|nr:MAG: M20 family metallopeptidase [Acidobacteriota bacterium]
MLALLGTFGLGGAAEGSPRTTARDWLAANESYLVEVADALWEIPEPGHQEVQTSEYLRGELARAGFSIDTGLAGLPTAFVASYGSGRPVIGIVALMDALPGLSQEKFATERRPVALGQAGHGCGHNLIGAADLGAALAIRHAIETDGLEGTIRFFGAPAEEIYHGGVYMVRDGIFDDLDALLFWHPSAVSTVISRSGLAMDSLRFVFRGRASDATDAATKGVNALTAAYRFADAVAGQSWPPYTVVNHVLIEGGTIPSIVPERATQWFFVHAPDRETVDELRGRLETLARDTDVGVEVQILSSTRAWLINRELGNLLDRYLQEDDPIAYTDDEVALARALQTEFAASDGKGEGESNDAFFTAVLPPVYTDEPVMISDDTAEAGWVTPRGGFLVACFPAGVPSHSWQWASSASSSFAHKGMLRAARTLTSSAIELLTNEKTLGAVRREFEETTRGKSYESPLPDGRGAFDYLRK